MGAGSKFSDPSNPAVVVKVGAPGSRGVLEITDMIFKTRGPGADYFLLYLLLDYEPSVVAGGAIVIEWNIHDPPGRQAVVGMWDSHVVLVGVTFVIHLARC